MGNIAIVVAVCMAIIGVLICVIVLLQSDRAAGLGALSGSSSPDSYWSKNKANSMEGALEKYTKILGAIFIILGIVINFIV